MRTVSQFAHLSGRGNVSFMPDIDDFIMPQDCRGLNSVIICDPKIAKHHPDFTEKVVRLATCVQFVLLEQPEPIAIHIEVAARRAVNGNAQMVVSIGGGSTLDTGKGVSQLLAGRGCLPESFERPGTFRAIAPHIAIPTTAGPGAEVSPAMVFSNSNGQKIAVVDDRLIPRHVLVIPRLATTLPVFETACCVLDGVAHSIEGAIQPGHSVAANITSTLTLRGFLRAMWDACETPDDLAGRERLAMLSIWSGEALRMTGVGAVHALASAVSGSIHAPHGAIVSTALVALLAEELSSADGTPYLDQLATDVGLSGASVLVSAITDFFTKFVLHDCSSASARDLESPGVARCVGLALADPRLAFHPTIIDADRAERIIRKMLATVPTVSLSRKSLWT